MAATTPNLLVRPGLTPGPPAETGLVQVAAAPGCRAPLGPRVRFVHLPGPPKETNIMAQYPKIESIGRTGSIIFAILLVHQHACVKRVDVCICIYVYEHMCVHTCIYIYIDVCVYVHMEAYLYTHS